MAIKTTSKLKSGKYRLRAIKRKTKKYKLKDNQTLAKNKPRKLKS